MPYFAEPMTGPNAVAATTRTGVFQFEQTTGAVALGVAGTIVTRRRSFIPQRVLKWRFHLRNYAFLSNTVPSGSLTSVQVAYGTLAPNATTGDATGACTAALTPINMSGSTLSGGNELVSDWQTTDIGSGKDTYFSVMFSLGSGDQLSFGGGEQWYATNAGDFTIAAPTDFTRTANQGFLNQYVEFKYADDYAPVLFNGPGNSLSGGGNGASYDNRGEKDSWGGQWLLRNRGVLPSIAVAGAWASNYGPSDPKWNYYDGLEGGISALNPDAVSFVATCSSDLVAGSVAAAKSNMVACILKARSVFPNARLIITNNPPRLESTGSGATSGTLEFARLETNKWLESSPAGVEQCLDINSIATDWANPARLRSVFDPGDGIHGRPIYYSGIARVMGDAVHCKRIA